MKHNSVVASLLLPLSCGHIGCASVAMMDLDGSLHPLRERFNAELDRPRVVAIFSPV